MPSRSKRTTKWRRFIALLRNLFVAAVLNAAIFGIIFLASNPKSLRGKLGIPASLDKSGPADIIKTSKKGITVKFAASSSSVYINPHANVFNRPKSAVIPEDGYLGERPHPDTEADLQLLVDECRGTEVGMEKVRNISSCLQFLKDDEKRYFKIPEGDARASRQDPKNAKYLDADGEGNTREAYATDAEAQEPSKTDLGTCPGPIIPFHSYWAGPATWRLEIFLKSYLYTQNLACSRLYLWVDEDEDGYALHTMFHKDPVFVRFLPFVERGDIKVLSWKFPSRIALAKHEDNADDMAFYKTPAKPNAKGETIVADGVIEDAEGTQWLTLTPKQMTVLPQYVPEAVRFVVLHLYGGLYLDTDILLLRDMRPLVLPRNHNFAQRWAASSHQGDYSMAVLSLRANSSLSSYLLHGGIRMGLNFNPRVIGRMAWKDNRHRELLMLETAFFDPVWTEYAWEREGRCTTPCLRDYNAVFKGREDAVKGEWESYDGEPLAPVDLSKVASAAATTELKSSIALPAYPTSTYHIRQQRISKRETPNLVCPSTDATLSLNKRNPPAAMPTESSDSFSPTTAEEAELRKAGVILDYDVDEDKFPPNNRTLANFFRGAFAYHLHNQWLKHPEPSSWLAALEHAHNGFFAGVRTNAYGETWRGPGVLPYNYWPEYV